MPLFSFGAGNREAGLPTGILRQFPGSLLALGALSLVSNLLMLTGPLYMMQVYDRVLASRSLPTLTALTVLVCSLYASYALIEAFRSRMMVRLGAVVDQRLGARLFGAAIRLRIVHGGQRGLDPVRDGDILRQFLSGAGPLSFLDLPWVPIYIAIIFAFDPALGWLAIAGAVLLLLLLVVNEIVSRRPAEESSLASGDRQRQTDDAVLNAESVVAMGMLRNLTMHWQRLSSTMLASQTRAADLSSVFTSLTKGLRFLLQSAVLAVGAFLVIQGNTSAGVMIAASVLMSRALAPIEQVVAHWRGFLGSRQAFGRIRQVLSVPAGEDRATPLPLPSASLTVAGVAAARPGTRSVLVSGVNFELRSGQALGVIGPSGAGKSSIARTIVGIWPAAAGEIRLDGVALGHFEPHQLGRMIGYLPQRIELFEGTVAENIARFTDNAPAEEIIRAAKLANVHELVLQLPEGYDTQLGAQGQSLSAGQQQRIALARAVYGTPFLVVLDEPNSNLDAEGDRALTDAIRALRHAGSIVVVIAHRPSAMTAVDQVLYVKDGRQVMFGPKDEVLAKTTQAPPSNVRRLPVG